MKGIIKCGLFVALSAVFSTVFFTGSSASAVSDWDNTINTTSILRLSDVGSGYDQTFTYEQFIPLAVEACDNTTIYPFVDRDYKTIINIFDASIGRHTIRVVAKDSQQSVTWLENPTGTHIARVPGGTTANRAFNFWWDGNQIYCQGSTGGNTVIGRYPPSTTETVWLYYTNMTANYPAGYEGEPLPNEYPPDPFYEHKPNITWSVNDKNVIVYSDSAKNTAVLDEYQIYWFISNTTTDMVQPSEPFALSGCTPPDYNNNFTVPIHFDYSVQAYYADQDCNILQEDNEGNRLTDNMVVLTIDGSTFDGSTTDHEAIIGEIEENAIVKAIRQFRPNDGGLAGLIYAPIEAVATLPTIVGSCSPITLPLLGENIQLQCIRPTIQASPMGGVYTTISIIITGIVTWWVAWRTFSTIKNIQDPQDDRVEVLKL